ncbi:MAG: hypothetical protein DRP95_05530, partial [Candidatus Latescibacterota bacterium]
PYTARAPAHLFYLALPDSLRPDSNDQQRASPLYYIEGPEDTVDVCVYGLADGSIETRVEAVVKGLPLIWLQTLKGEPDRGFFCHTRVYLTQENFDADCPSSTWWIKIRGQPDGSICTETGREYSARPDRYTVRFRKPLIEEYATARVIYRGAPDGSIEIRYEGLPEGEWTCSHFYYGLENGGTAHRVVRSDGSWLLVATWGNPDSTVTRAISRSLPWSGPTLAFTFIDVWQGDAILISTPNDRHYLVDCGPPEYAYRVIQTLEGHGVTHLDGIVPTHPDADHYGGFVQLLRDPDFSFGTVYLNTDNPPDSLWGVFQFLVDSLGLARRYVERGDTLGWDPELYVQVLNPSDPLYSGTGSDDNNNSIELRIRYDAIPFLLTGDIEFEAIEDLIATYGDSLYCYVLKVSHHGSYNGTTPDFLEHTLPTYAIISCGAGNPYGHPHTETLQYLREWGCAVKRTDRLGTIEVLTDGDHVTLYSGL